MRCRSGSHCDRPAEKGRRFCAEHAAELHRMREELTDAAAARIGRGRPKRAPTRSAPAAYCATCAAAGYVEEPACPRPLTVTTPNTHLGTGDVGGTGPRGHLRL